MIDGLSNVSAFVRLVLPSNLGAVVAVAVFATVLSWSEVLFASLLTTDKTQTLTMACPRSSLSRCRRSAGTHLASAILASVPIVVAFALVQKRFFKGSPPGRSRDELQGIR